MPVEVKFKIDTIKRKGYRGDNWCLTWAADGSQITSMDDGNWLQESDPESDEMLAEYHHYAYRIAGSASDFGIDPLENYPPFHYKDSGWFGYGILSVNGILYSMLSLTPEPDWSGPFQGTKLLRSIDNGKSWHSVGAEGTVIPIAPGDRAAKEDKSAQAMFFYQESGITRDAIPAYPFSFCDFVQHGQDNAAAPDAYIYIYSPEGAYSNKLLLARVHKDNLHDKSSWEFFRNWQEGEPKWTGQLSERGYVHEFPATNAAGDHFGWYSWLPSVVWNEGLGLYIMANGGTYGGVHKTDSDEDYFHRWMHNRTGCLGFWYSEHPYGPWTRFHYVDHWIADDQRNLIYQPKLSPKWISNDGKTMILIWSDAMKNEAGRSHTTNYKWNQMEIEIVLAGEEEL